jgi:hypothetical protein
VTVSARAATATLDNSSAQTILLNLLRTPYLTDLLRTK